MDIDVTQEHWAAYYRGGALVSCPTNPEPGYEGRVREAWEDYFGALPGGSRVLDLGTGNGPIALIARTVSDANGLDLRITGVDLADIDPVQDVADGARLFAGIEFQGGVSTESLPFPDAGFDAISGQYIVEYTDTTATLAEMARVLVAGGRVQLILHHVDSIIAANARESLGEAELARRDERIVEKAGRYFEAAAKPGTRTEAARRALIDAGKRLEAAAERSPNPIFLDFVLRSITTLLEHHARLSRGDLVKQLQRLDRELDLWERRLADLVGAAMSEGAMQAFVEAARDKGFDAVDYALQHQGEDVVVGWRFNAVKP